MIHLTIILQ